MIQSTEKNVRNWNSAVPARRRALPLGPPGQSRASWKPTRTQRKRIKRKTEQWNWKVTRGCTSSLRTEAYKYMYIYTCNIYVYIHTHTHTHTHIYIYIYVYIYIYSSKSDLRSSSSTETRARRRAPPPGPLVQLREVWITMKIKQDWPDIYIHTYTYIHTYIYTYTYIHGD